MIQNLHIFCCVVILALLANSYPAHAQEMTLDDAISTARSNSVQALEARQAFVSTYWAWRSYRASRLPSLHLYGNMGNFNRSLTLLQNPEDGSMNYVSTNNMQNSIGLQAQQNIPLTGGTLYIYTDLNRIDQFGPDRAVTWYSQPVTISYQQPLFGFNQFKWDKLIEPKEYEKGRRAYIESMEQITLNAVNAWFNVLVAKEDESIAQTNYRNTERMFQVASERVELGTITRDEYLQLELRMLNDSIAINEKAILVREEQMVLNSLLGFNESALITPILDERLPAILIDYEDVLNKALANSKFNLENEISLLYAHSDVEKAKAERGITMGFNARFGLSKSGVTLPDAYRNPLDQEVFGLSFSVPIFDWGKGRGRIEKAKAAEEVVKAQVQQSENDFRRKIFTAVGQFNNQRQQCDVSRRAAAIAGERYVLVMDKFRMGSATVLELNTARTEYETARKQYITDLSNFWVYYYTLRKYTLYDYITGEDIGVDDNELIQTR